MCVCVGLYVCHAFYAAELCMCVVLSEGRAERDDRADDAQTVVVVVVAGSVRV